MKEKIKEEVKKDCPELEEQHLKLCAKGINLSWLFDKIQDLAIEKTAKAKDIKLAEMLNVMVADGKLTKKLAKEIIRRSEKMV